MVLEARDGVALASFYASLLGWPIAKQDHDGAAIAVPGTSSYLAFQSSPDYVPPVWPAADGRQQMMMHIDVAVDDLAAALVDAVELGATVAEDQPQCSRSRKLYTVDHRICTARATLDGRVRVIVRLRRGAPPSGVRGRRGASHVRR